jgi:hypothetical protein
MSFDNEPDSGYQLRCGPSAALIAWCIVGLLVFAIGVTVIQ